MVARNNCKVPFGCGCAGKSGICLQWQGRRTQTHTRASPGEAHPWPEGDTPGTYYYGGDREGTEQYGGEM